MDYILLILVLWKKNQGSYSDIFDMRQTADYNDYIDFNKEDVLDLIDPANELITKIEGLLLKK